MRLNHNLIQPLNRDSIYKTMSPPHNILVIRNDKLGDFMLAWPTFALLKKQYPKCKLTVLVPEYTRPIAEQCIWIDHVIIDKRHKSLFQDVKYLAALIKDKQFDASISLFSESRSAIALWLAGVPNRVAPATKFAQIFYTHRLIQRRSRSEKPEFEYNLDLARYFIKLNGGTAVTPKTPPYLQFDNDQINKIRNNYRKENNIKESCKLVIIHPGSGGSAINLSLQQYAELARLISIRQDVHFTITAGPDELPFALELEKLLTGIPHSIYHSINGLVEFSKFISICDLFISGSTGPLHIAGALNIPTAAFYSAKKSATSLRWQTLNDERLRLVFKPDQYTGASDMSLIDMNSSAHSIVDCLDQSRSGK
jgi:ADP-heptose:LPS heptosyltransferase